MQTCLTIAIGDVEKMVQKATDAKGAAFGIIKIKLGTSAKDDIERMRAIREAIGRDVLLRIDANQGWDAPTAIKILNALEDFDIEYCELHFLSSEAGPSS